jgi:hypothetical protein
VAFLVEDFYGVKKSLDYLVALLVITVLLQDVISII